MENARIRIFLIFASVLILSCKLISLLGHGWYDLSVTVVRENVKVTSTLTLGLFYVSPYKVCIDGGNGSTCKEISELSTQQALYKEAATNSLRHQRYLFIVGLVMMIVSQILLCQYICIKRWIGNKRIGITCGALLVKASSWDISCTVMEFYANLEGEKVLQKYEEATPAPGVQIQGHLSFPWPVIFLGIAALWEFVAGFVLLHTSCCYERCCKKSNTTMITHQEQDDEALLVYI